MIVNIQDYVIASRPPPLIVNCASHLGARAFGGQTIPLRALPLQMPYSAANTAVMSSMRLEKPHSLSYQASTLTSVPPMTRVCVAS